MVENHSDVIWLFLKIHAPILKWKNNTKELFVIDVIVLLGRNHLAAVYARVQLSIVAMLGEYLANRHVKSVRLYNKGLSNFGGSKLVAHIKYNSNSTKISSAGVNHVKGCFICVNRVRGRAI